MAIAQAIMSALLLTSTGLHFLEKSPQLQGDLSRTILHIGTIFFVLLGLVACIKMHPERHKKAKTAHFLMLSLSIILLLPGLFLGDKTTIDAYYSFVTFLWYLPVLFASFLLAHPFKDTRSLIHASEFDKLNDKRTQFFFILLSVSYCFELIQVLPPFQALTGMAPYHFMLLIFSAIAIHFVKMTELISDLELLAHPSPVRTLEDVEELQCLSPRERELLAHLHNGLDFDLIADRMFLSVKTVRNHASNIYTKLSCKNRVALMKKLNDLLSNSVK